MREMHQSSSARSRSRERGSTHLKKQMAVSSDMPQNNYSFSSELSRSSSKKLSGIPMKCLIEEELKMKENKTRHPSPGVIARLMGLDTLPPSPPKKPHSDCRGPHYHKMKREASPETLNHVPSISHEKYVFTEDELPEFKDVYEISEVRKGKKKLHYSPARSKNSSPEMDFVRQKFADAKRLSTEESLRGSMEFDDTIEALETNRDVLVQFLSEPNSLFAKQLKDLSFLPSSPPHSASQITILKPSCKRTPGVNLETDGSFHYRKRASDFSSHSHEDDFVSLTFEKPIKSKRSSQPTNIVVLKPSLDKARRKAAAGAFPVFYPEGSSALSRFTNGEDSVGTRAKSSREIARQVTRQMRRAVNATEPNIYSPDSNLLYEFNPLYDSDQSYYASPKPHHQVESSVSKEARKRLSDRWKTTRMTDEAGPLAGCGATNTMGELLTIPDVMSCEKSRKDKCILGISSNDGWKDQSGNFRNLPRLKSVPSSSSCHARVGHKSSGHRRRGSRASEFCMLKDVLDVGPTKGLLREEKERTHTTFDALSEGEVEGFLTEKEIHVNSEELKLQVAEDIKIEEVGSTEEAVTKDEDVAGPVQDDVEEKQEVMEQIGSSKEAEEQLSPNSTLDSPFEDVAADEDEEGTSTSGCFEKISADLQELRMQLNLLKRDSIGEQGDIFLLSDEEDNNIDQTKCPELGNSDLHFRDEEERDFSYLLDVVTDLGGHASTRDELLSLCYSLDCPMGPSTFARLEKKYGNVILWPKSERKMMFDLINSTLSEIIGSWVEAGKRFSAVFMPKWERNEFTEEVWGKVVKRRREIECGGDEIFLEAWWSEVVKNGVDLVGREIETTLLDDLLCELVTELVNYYY